MDDIKYSNLINNNIYGGEMNLLKVVKWCRRSIFCKLLGTWVDCVPARAFAEGAR
jgi:hypothetical protein